MLNFNLNVVLALKMGDWEDLDPAPQPEHIKIMFPLFRNVDQ